MCAASMPANIYVCLQWAIQPTAIKYMHTPSMPVNIYVHSLWAVKPTYMWAHYKQSSCPTHTTYETLPDNLALIRRPHSISMYTVQGPGQDWLTPVQTGSDPRGPVHGPLNARTWTTRQVQVWAMSGPWTQSGTVWTACKVESVHVMMYSFMSWYTVQLLQYQYYGKLCNHLFLFGPFDNPSGIVHTLFMSQPYLINIMSEINWIWDWLWRVEDVLSPQRGCKV